MMLPVLGALIAATGMFVTERAPVAMYLVTPPSAKAAAPSAQIYSAAERALEERTGLQVWSMERAGVAPAAIDGCEVEARMSCWTQQMRAAPVRYFWALAVQPLPDGRDRLMTIFFDVEASVRIYQRWLDSNEASWRERAEEEIFAASVVDKGEAVRTTDPAALAEYFERVLEEALRPVLERDEQWRPYGRVHLEVPTEGFELRVDDRSYGPLPRGETTLLGLRPGLHVVEGIAAPHVSAHRAEVVRGEVVRIVLVPPPRERHPLRGATLYGGAAVAATGAALTAWALVRANDGVRSGCLERAGATTTCDELGGVTFGYDPSAAPTTDVAAVDSGGVVIGALGAALVAAGASWVVGALLFGDEEDAPWWSLVVGAAAGGVVFGGGQAIAR